MLLFGDVCDRAGPFLKFEKNRHMATRKLQFGCGSVHLKTVVFGFGFKTVTALLLCVLRIMTKCHNTNVIVVRII